MLQEMDATRLIQKLSYGKEKNNKFLIFPEAFNILPINIYSSCP
jgi:hypothetical protein